MGLEVDNEDVEEFVEDHSIELTAEDLVTLHKEQKRLWLRAYLWGRRMRRKLPQVL